MRRGSLSLYRVSQSRPARVVQARGDVNLVLCTYFECSFMDGQLSGGPDRLGADRLRSRS